MFGVPLWFLVPYWNDPASSWPTLAGWVSVICFVFCLGSLHMVGQALNLVPVSRGSSKPTRFHSGDPWGEDRERDADPDDGFDMDLD